MTGKVILEGLEFHAYHGVYPAERSSGNKFEVDVSVETEINASAFEDDLGGTINYEALYDVVKSEMAKPSKLLERVGHAIAARILTSFPQALSVQINISKFNPPIGGVCKKASVTISQHRKK
jgi:dihydroneopterin aldolase